MERCEAKNGKTCSTFRTINCIHDKMFIRPKVDGKSLDWCATTKDGKQDCGKAAANAFCIRNGFSHGAWSFNGPFESKVFEGSAYVGQDTVALDADDGYAPASKLKVCDSKKGDCTTFISINCEK